MTERTKTCSRCHQAKPLDDFKTDTRKPDGKASSCKACNAVPKVGNLLITPSRALVRMFDSNDPEAWIARIAEEWRNSVEAIMQVGRSLIEAKAALPHGAFLQMLEDEELPFGASTAQRLMAVARDRRLSNAAYLQYLPASWGTLYELTKLSDEEFTSAIDQRVIRPDMMRAEVELIRPLARPRIPEPAEAFDPDHTATGGVLIPSRVAEQSGEEDAGETRSSSAGAVPSPALLAPGEPASVEGACGHAPPEFSSALPNGSRAIMGSRQEAADSLDFFPTPPWATRALFEHVLAHLERKGHCKWQTAWEPACGEGHIAEVMGEYFKAVFATDIHDYGYGHVRDCDFLKVGPQTNTPDWIVTNPPFNTGEAFVLKALGLAGTGVAMFMRVQWLETAGRYENVFRDTPPTLIAFFAERVPLCKGRWNPEGNTASAYMWLVWIKGAEPRAPFWIPPGQREALTKSDDVARFTQRPVPKRPSLLIDSTEDAA